MEKVCTPIITKMYQGAGGGMPGGMPDMSGAAGGDSADKNDQEDKGKHLL